MVNQLAMETRKVMKGSHSRKTAAFVRVSLSLPPLTGEEEPCLQLSSGLLLFSIQACAAYSFITIPSLSNIFSRLNLYLLSGQVALSNQCLSQGERTFCDSFGSIFSTFVIFLGSFPTLSFSYSLIFPIADAFLKAAVSVLPEVPRSISVEGKFRPSESFLLDYINNFLATLLVVPVTQFI